MPWFDVVELFVADQIHDGLLICLRNAAFDELVQQQEHLFFRKGPAVEQNFADSQDLTVGKARLVELLQAVTFCTPVISDWIDKADVRRLVLKIFSDIVDVPLDAPLIYAILPGLFCFVYDTAVHQFCINS